MNLQRKVYATRGEKVVDFLIGIAVWHMVNIVLSIGYALLSGVLNGGVPYDPTITPAIGALTIAVGCLPFFINIALLIYFGLTRYWITLGMLGTFAVYLLLTICALVVFGVVCFSALSGTTPTPGF